MGKGRLSIKRIAIYLLILIFLSVAVYIGLSPLQGAAYVKITISDCNTGEVQLYYAIEGMATYNDQNSANLPIGTERTVLKFPTPRDIKSIRFDFGSETKGTAVIEQIEIKNGDAVVSVSGNELYDIFQASKVECNQVDMILHGSTIRLVSKGTDPYIAFNTTELSMATNANIVPTKLLVAVICALIFTALIYRYVYLSDIIMLFRNLIKSSRLLLKLSTSDFKIKYAGSSFGFIWAFIQPIFTILLFWFVFQVGFKSIPVYNVPFILWLMSGIVPWFFFSDSWSNMTGVFSEYSYLVKKIVFRIDILPVIKLISAWFVHVFFIFFMVFVFMLYGYMPAWRMLGMLYYMGCLGILILGLGFITASLVVFFKDVAPLMGIILQFGMWLTPIMWDTGFLSPKVVLLFKLNPMYYIVQGYRHCMLGTSSPSVSLSYTIYFWLATVAIFMVGISLFHRLKPHFADVL